ncbi:biogenesis of lysosome-related organelles complex 1 subunit 4-like [Ceratina calcarata]|uniref:Biogenesis of lysosome-related organelles complex 1 subunit 4-like n=1 Tax=Ceratina calcarata TaxID=156304 RepID=A0AAJ7JEU1_9HYME|nr:biogenesis of lysosome-related organelles complex 1 subunit 4-like [Ceratina calcarata]XP_026674823.1 biogenesis of lysosome-related organelles complex 1 subunit 4-like [Ceratina calcarata]XP_026674824.1 biogenesis of lysosome-related organelles complex 1 subunit 4-like [Ceratina calcarata]
MSSQTGPMVEELAKDYANYLKLDLSSRTKNFLNMIEDVMMRLEEFQSIIEMVRSESSQCMEEHVPRLRDMQQEIVDLGKRMDALEHVIAMVNVNLTTLEAAVDNAEAELGISDSRLFGILNPLSFFKKTQEPVLPNRLPIYEPPTIYRTSDYFKSE